MAVGVGVVRYLTSTDTYTIAIPQSGLTSVFIVINRDKRDTGDKEPEPNVQVPKPKEIGIFWNLKYEIRIVLSHLSSSPLLKFAFEEKVVDAGIIFVLTQGWI